MSVPPVTMGDLKAFQAKHFPASTPTPTHDYPIEGTGQNYDYDYEYGYEEEDDDLGYYPDGAKRSLTDEQIRIFRHSEIHALRREKEAEEEALAERSREQQSENADTERGDEVHGNNSSNPAGGLSEIPPEQTRGNGSEETPLDYDEGQTVRKTQGSFSNPPFPGRRIISYED